MNLDPFKQLQLYGYENYFNELKNLYVKNKLPNKILLNGKSNFSVLPEKLKKMEADIDTNNDGIIQDAELEKAINIIRKYKEKNKHNI